MRIGLLGASGAAGRALLPLLAARGDRVRAAAHRRAPGAGATETMDCDILVPRTLRAFVADCDAVVNLATAIPVGGDADWALNDRIRREGTSNLVAACRAMHVRRLVQQSVAMLHCVDDGRPQTESDPIRGEGRIASAADMEDIVKSSGLDWVLARGALFYGPGTRREERWRTEMSQPGFILPGDGTEWHSSVHVADFADGICRILELAAAREAYIVADDEPLRLRDLYGGLARRFGVAPPGAGAASRARSVRVSNLKLRGLGWAPRYPTLWRGLATRDSAPGPA